MCESARTDMSYLGDILSDPKCWCENPRLIPFGVPQKDYEKFCQGNVPKGKEGYNGQGDL